MSATVYSSNVAFECNVEKSVKKFLDTDVDQDQRQNVIVLSIYHCGHFLSISSKSVHTFSSYLKKTHKQTDAVNDVTSLVEA